MARLETWYKQDLKKPLIVHKHSDVFNQDNRGNLIGVEVYSNGEPVTLAGSVSGYCLLADGTTVPAVGARRSGNKASVLIPQTAYGVPGPITITIKNVEGNDITTLCAVVGLVRQSVSGNLVNPGSVVTDWSNSINAQLQAVQTAADNVGAIVAAPFNENTVYVVGNYVTNNGNLYRITGDHASGVAWADTSKVQCTVGSELSDLKSALEADEYTPGTAYATGDMVWRNGTLYKSKGNFTDASWTAGHWTKTALADEILQIVRELCGPYDATRAYAVGSYVRSATDVYRCITAVPDGGEPWTAGHWTKVTGGTYSDIGTKVAALTSDIVNVSGDLEAVEADVLPIKKDMISSGGMFPASFFDVGGIDTSGVVVPSVRYRVCTPDTFTVKNDMVITIDEGYVLSLWLYPVDASAYVQHGSGFTIPANTDARVLIRKVPEDTSAVADVDEFASALFLKLNEFEPHKINQLSYDIPDDRYKNIDYVDLLAEIPSIDRRSAWGVYIDYDVRFHANPYSIRMLTAEGENIISSEIRFTLPSAFTLAGTQEFDMFVYIPDATGITNFSLRTMTGGFVKSNYPGIVSGWNHFRFFTEGAGNVDFTASVTTFRFIVTHAANTAKNIYIAGLLQIKPDKGNLIMVDDGPYQSFYDFAYPAFKAINCPVTWAIDPLLLGDSADPNRQNCSQAEIDALAYDGISEFSFHNYDGTIMSTASAQEALADTLNCIRYLRKNGIEPQRIFRASWLQNSCPNHELADLEVDASATYNGGAGITMYPFPDRYNIARFSMQGRTTAAIDDIFDKLKNQHCTVFMYTHGISDDSDKNLTNALLQYYVSKIEAGISEGWLNATTYNRLVSYYERIK